MDYSDYNLSTPPSTRPLSPNTNFYLDTAVEYLASSEGWSGCEDANDNSGYHSDSPFALANSGNVGNCQRDDAFLPNEETMVNFTSFQAQTVDLLPAQATGYPQEVPALLNTSPPYCHSLEAANLDWRHQPSSSEECSLDGESKEREQFSDMVVPMRQWSTDEMSQATHGHLAAAVGGTTSTKTSNRGAPHRHRRQFLEGDEKIRRTRDLNNEASRISRRKKKNEKLESQSQYQNLEQENRNLLNEYNSLEAHAQWCRSIHSALQSCVPYMDPAPRPVSPFLPYADQDASTLTNNAT